MKDATYFRELAERVNAERKQLEMDEVYCKHRGFLKEAEKYIQERAEGGFTSATLVLYHTKSNLLSNEVGEVVRFYQLRGFDAEVASLSSVGRQSHIVVKWGGCNHG